jgi:GDP-4-dehydro-6-deoxy-D-mannose reductase
VYIEVKILQRAFVTGAFGFIGMCLIDHIQSLGWDVMGYDRRTSAHSRFPAYQGDLRDQDQLRHMLNEFKPDVIFHLAGILKSEEPRAFFETNLMGTLALFESILASGLRPCVLNASSSAVYGPTKGSHLVTERSALHPVTEYAVSKVAQEMAGLRYYHAFGMPVIVVRMFNLLGPGQSPSLACSAFARQIALAEVNGRTEIVTGNLDASRDFVDVRDAVRALSLLAEKGHAGEIYNICSGRAVTIRSCLYEMMSQSKKQLTARVDAGHLQKNDIPVQIGSYQKLHDATGWSPKISLEQSLSDLLNDWRRRVKEVESK